MPNSMSDVDVRGFDGRHARTVQPCIPRHTIQHRNLHIITFKCTQSIPITRSIMEGESTNRCMIDVRFVNVIGVPYLAATQSIRIEMF